MRRRIVKVLAAVTALVLVGGVYLGSVTGAGAGDQFSDVPDTHPFHDEIAWMATTGISTGYSDGTYRPGSAVTRQAMAAFMYRLWILVGGQPGVYPDPGFSDIAASNPFYDKISWMAASGITTGFPDGTFRPTAGVSRQAMAAFMLRLWELVGGQAGAYPDPALSDIGPNPFYDEIAWMAGLEITRGYSDGTFRPTVVVTRQAMAAFLARLHANVIIETVPIVTTAVDGLDRIPGDGRCETTTGVGDCSLRAAIDETNAHPTIASLEIAAGVNPTLTLAGADEDANATGDLDVRGDLTVDGNGATIDAAGIDRVLDVRAGSVIFSGLAVTGGQSDDGAGGIVVAGGSTLRMVESSVSGNQGTTAGGIAATGALELVNSTVADNVATVGTGGLLASGGTSLTFATIGGNTGPGADAVSGGVTATASVFADAGGVACDGVVTSLGYNVDGDATCLDGSGPGDLAAAATSLGPLAGSSAISAVLVPQADSAVVDVVPLGVCAGLSNVDQRGRVRPEGGGCDAGAVEVLEPVRLGAGGDRNYLGLGSMDGGGGEEGFWLSINGYCSRRSQGDFRSPRFARNYVAGSGTECPPPEGPGPDYASPYTILNPTFVGDCVALATGCAAAVEFTINLPDAGAGVTGSDYNVLLYDAAMFGSTSGGSPDLSSRPVSMAYGMRAPDATPATTTDNSLASCAGQANPTTFAGSLASDDVSTFTGPAGNPGGAVFGGSRWTLLCTVPAGSPAGDYILQAESLDGESNSNGIQNFGVFVQTGLSTTACDRATDSTCPVVNSRGFLPIYARAAAFQAAFPLAAVADTAAGQRLEVMIFDPGEGGNYLQIRDPNGAAATLSYTTVDDNDPATPEYSDTGVTLIDTSGTTAPPPGNVSASRFNDRFIRVVIDLPADFATAYPSGSRQWTVFYDFNSSVTDRTAWQATIVDAGTNGAPLWEDPGTP